MARQKTDLRLSLSGHSGETVRLNLTLDVFGERWHVYRDGVLAKSFPHASSTVIAQQLAKWLRGQQAVVLKSRAATTSRANAGVRQAPF